MSFTDKAKKKIGEATDNKDLQAEGQADQTQAGLKQAGDNIKDGTANAKDAAKDTFTKD